MKITIIGGGITGLTAALVLLKKGFKCNVYENADSLAEVGAGIWMQPNAMKVLDYLEIGNQVRKSGMELNQVEITNQNLIPFIETDEKFVTDSLDNKIISIHRARLQKILFEALPSNTIHFDEKYISHQNVNGKIQINFSDNNLETDVLLGADGINSLVRKNLFTSELRFSGQTCWRGVAQLKLDDEYLAVGKETWGNNLRFGFANISPTEVYWFAVSKASKNEKEDILKRKDNLLKMYHSFHPLISEIIQNTAKDKIIRHDINDLKRLETWHQENVCLLGDAGHATTPNMGQGAGQGIEDAYYIGQYLSQKESPNEAFVQFEKARRKKVDYVVNNSWMFGKMAHNTFGRMVMKLIMKLTPQKILLKQLQTLYSVNELD